MTVRKFPIRFNGNSALYDSEACRFFSLFYGGLKIFYHRGHRVTQGRTQLRKMTYPVPSVSPVVKLLSRFNQPRRADFLKFMTHAFDLCEHAQQIAAKYLVNVFRAVAAIKQGLGNLG